MHWNTFFKGKKKKKRKKKEKEKKKKKQLVLHIQTVNWNVQTSTKPTFTNYRA